MRAKKIKEVRKLLGIESDFNKEYPLFWSVDEDGFYVAGDYKLTKDEFEKIRRRQVCWVENKTYL